MCILRLCFTRTLKMSRTYKLLPRGYYCPGVNYGLWMSGKY